MGLKFTNFFLIYGFFFISCIVFSLLINGLFLKFVKTLGIRNPADGTVIRWGSQSKPAIGGISFYIVFLFSIAAYSFTLSTELIGQNQQFLGLLMSSTIGFLIGLTDDAYNTNPVLKFLVQVMCGLTLISTGTYIHLFESDNANYLLTIFWVIGIMNSINLLDNMDGIATIVAITIVCSGLILIWVDADYSSINFIVLLGILAALIGFLVYNWHPSRIYMGDTGSQFLGVFLAFIGIVYFWNQGAIGASGIAVCGIRQIAIPVLIFILPIFDTTFVFLNRIRKGKSPFVGGKDHTTHRLAYLGFSEKKVALLFFSISACSSALAIFLFKFVGKSTTILFLICGFYLLVAFCSFIYISHLTLKHKRLKIIKDRSIPAA